MVPSRSAKSTSKRSGVRLQTQSVVWMYKCSTVLIKHTTTPHQGPIAKEPIKAGSSERSILINAGMNGTEKSRNIKIYATADNIAVTVRYLTLTLFSVLFTVAVCVLIVTRLLFCLNLEFEVNITCNKIPRIYEYPGLIQVSLLNSTC